MLKRAEKKIISIQNVYTGKVLVFRSGWMARIHNKNPLFQEDHTTLAQDSKLQILFSDMAGMVKVCCQRMRVEERNVLP